MVLEVFFIKKFRWVSSLPENLFFKIETSKIRDRNFEKIGIGFGKKFVKIGRSGIPGIKPRIPDRFSTRLFLKNRKSSSSPKPDPVSK
jgi:hypothetical protein